MTKSKYQINSQCQKTNEFNPLGILKFGIHLPFDICTFFISKFYSFRSSVLGQKSEKGSILIGVLWSLFLLGALAVVINAYVTPQLLLAEKLRERTTLYYLAKAGVERAILEIEVDKTESYDALNESWSNFEDGFKKIELGEGGRFSIKYQLAQAEGEEEEGEEGEEENRYGLIDEERKININKASFAILKQFFEIAGETSSQLADEIAASIIDWIDEDDEPEQNGAESDYYESLESGYPCKNKAFEVLEELLLVRGMTQEIFDKVSDSMTIYSTGAVNINTADKLVLQSLAMSESLGEKIVAFRKGSDGQEATEDDNVFESVESIVDTLNSAEGLSPKELDALNSIITAGLLTVRSDNFMGRSFGEFKDQEASMSIVFVVNRDKVIKYWREP